MKSFRLLFALMLLAAFISLTAQNRSRRMEVRKNVPVDSIRLSDPFVLADTKTKTYYMTGTGGFLWKSKDLKFWDGPYNVVQTDPDSWMGPRPMIWAAELHQYNGKYYYLDVTFENALSTNKNNPPYMFFNIESKEALKYYLIYENEYEDVVCNSTKYNYYHKMGLYFSSLDTLKDVFEKYLLTDFDTSIDNYFYFKISDDLIDVDVRKTILEIKKKYWDSSWKWNIRRINSYYALIIPAMKDL